jgi:hypothetical protein
MKVLPHVPRAKRMCMACRSIRLVHNAIAGNTLLHILRDTRERVSVQPRKENANMKSIKVTFVVAALALLGGCMAVPVSPGYYGGAPGYYATPPAYYASPVYYGPSIGFGIYGGGRGYGRGRGWR